MAEAGDQAKKKERDAVQENEVVREHRQQCAMLIDARAVLTGTQQQLKAAGVRARRAKDEAATWKRKTQAFYLGQPSTKKTYKARWDAAEVERRTAESMQMFLRTRLRVEEQRFRSQLQRTTDCLVQLSSEFADGGERAAQICICEAADWS